MTGFGKRDQASQSVKPSGRAAIKSQSPHQLDPHSRQAESQRADPEVSRRPSQPPPRQHDTLRTLRCRAWAALC